MTALLDASWRPGAGAEASGDVGAHGADALGGGAPGASAAHSRLHHITVSDGAILAVEDSTPLTGAAGDRATLLCIHGWAADSRFFAPQAAALSRDFRVIRLDLRGHGRSARQAPFTLDQLARDCADIAAALSLTTVVAVGWSMGAMALWRAMARDAGFAARVAGLVVIDMAARIANGPDWGLGLASQEGVVDDGARMTRAMRRDWRSFAAGFAPSVFAPDAPTPLTRTWSALFAHNDPAVMAAFWTSLTETDCRADVQAISAPMLICYGERSRLYRPESAHWLAQAASHGRAVGFAHSGHAPHLEEPDFFNRLISEFAGTTATVRPARRDVATIPSGAEAGGQTVGRPPGAASTT